MPSMKYLHINIHSMGSLQDLLVASALGLLALQVLLFIQQALFAPLSKVPGPFLTRISSIPIFAHDHFSHRTEWIRLLHVKYGPVVRVAPGEVSVVSPTGIRDIFSGRGGSGGGSGSSGAAFPKSKVFELFKHFGARNCFTSLTHVQHGWRRKIIGGSYTQTAVLGREAATGNIWRIVGNYLDAARQQGLHDSRQDQAVSIDVHKLNTLFAAEAVSSHVLLRGLKPMEGDPRHQRLVLATQEKPGDMLSYLHQEYRQLFTWIKFIKTLLWNVMPGHAGPVPVSERTRNGDKDQKKLGSKWMGGTEYRDLGYHSYLESKAALEADPHAWTHGSPITVKLASNVVAGERLVKEGRKPIIEDAGMRAFQEYGNFITDAGAASETMDHLIAGQDTTSETLSHALQALSSPENAPVQKRLRAEIATLDLDVTHSKPLTAEQLTRIMRAPWLDAVVKETLRRYPPHTTNIHRQVPVEGRVLDGFYLPGNTKVGTSALVVHLDKDVFGKDPDVWRPDRWCEGVDEESIRRMENTMWAFGSGTRGCIGKHLAMVEIKLLLCGVYSRYSTKEDKSSYIPASENHFLSRTTNRDYVYFPEASGYLLLDPQPAS